MIAGTKIDYSLYRIDMYDDETGISTICYYPYFNNNKKRGCMNDLPNIFSLRKGNTL